MCLCSAQVEGLASTSGLRIHCGSLSLFRHFHDVVTCLLSVPTCKFDYYFFVIWPRNYYQEMIRNDKTIVGSFCLPAHPDAINFIFLPKIFQICVARKHQNLCQGPQWPLSCSLGWLVLSVHCAGLVNRFDTTNDLLSSCSLFSLTILITCFWLWILNSLLYTRSINILSGHLVAWKEHFNILKFNFPSLCLLLLSYIVI